MAQLAAALGAEELGADAMALAERLAEGRFFVACVGAFKRGKSTLINALVGAPVLPTGIVPVTAVPTVLRYGASPGARVRRQAGQWEEIDVAALADFVSEDGNPGNVRGVAAVEVFLPADLLRHGISLVDTPGLGSIFATASEATRAFVPHIDAALLVTGIDPPLSADELSLFRDMATVTPHLVVVVNKADRHSPDEVAEAVAFVDRAIGDRAAAHAGAASSRAARRLSAINALRGVEPRYDWTLVTGELCALADASGRALVRAAGERGLRRLVAEARREVATQRAALERPLEETARRAGSLRAMSEDVAHRRLVLGHLFAAEEEGLHRALDGHRHAFREEVERDAVAELDAALAAIESRPARGPVRRRKAMEAARAVARQRLMPWFAAESKAGEALYGEIGARYVAAANEYLARLAAADPEALDDAFGDRSALDAESGFRVRSGFFYTDMMTIGSPVAPGAWLLDLVAPRTMTARRVHRDAEAYLRRLLEVNTSRVVGDIRDRVLESRRGLEAAIDRLLRGVYARSRRALERAREAQAGGAQAVRGELERLAAIEAELGALDGSQAAPHAPSAGFPD